MKDTELIQYGAKHDGVWCWAVGGGPTNGTSRTGKWMLWPIGEEALVVWQIICQLTMASELGFQAKISCRAERELAGERLICVYTADSDDLPDLQRVVNILRSQLNPNYRLIYKEDSMTRAGFYRDADHPVSKWYVRPGEMIIRAVQGYRPVQDEE